MSHITLAQQGLAAAEAKDWEAAIAKLSSALAASTNPAWLLARSKSLVHTGRYAAALADADLAWHTAYARSNRALMVDANYRRAVAYLRQGRLADADACCVFAIRLARGGPALEPDDDAALAPFRDPATGRWIATAADAVRDAQAHLSGTLDGGAALLALRAGPPSPRDGKESRLASTLRVHILTALDKLSPDDPARTLTVSSKPDEKCLANIVSSPRNDDDEKLVDSPPNPAAAAAQKPAVPRDTSLRIQEFQTNTTMSVSIFSKAVDQEKLKVDFQPTSVHLDRVFYPSGDERDFKLNLWAEIDASASKYTVTPNKVELVLAKKTPGKWAQLESSSDDDDATAPLASALAATKIQSSSSTAETAAPTDDENTDAVLPATTTRTEATKLSYPSSSRTGPKDWDKFDTGDDDDDNNGGDVNIFFKKLFEKGTPAQQRAMMKSFTESNGTTLSTDWDDVKGRTVETTPPEGFQVKKWE